GGVRRSGGALSPHRAECLRGRGGCVGCIARAGRAGDRQCGCGGGGTAGDRDRGSALSRRCGELPGGHRRAAQSTRHRTVGGANRRRATQRHGGADPCARRRLGGGRTAGAALGGGCRLRQRLVLHLQGFELEFVESVVLVVVERLEALRDARFLHRLGAGNEAVHVDIEFVEQRIFLRIGRSRGGQGQQGGAEGRLE